MNDINDTNICGEIQELMIPYLNHLATREETGRLVLHIAECAICMKEMTENIKLHSKIKLTFNQIPSDIKTRAYDKINFPQEKLSVTELIADDIITAVHAPILELYSKLMYSLTRNPVKRIINYTFSQINAINTERG